LKILLKGQSINNLYKASTLIAHIVADTMFEKYFLSNRQEFVRLARILLFETPSQKTFLEILNTVFPNREHRNMKKRLF